MRRNILAVCTLLVATSSSLSPRAFAQAPPNGAPQNLAKPATGDEKAAAEALYDEAQKLIAENHYAEACPKLEDSQRRDPGIGTMLYLADCYEKIGRVASAWAQFREAEDLAVKANDQRAEVAKRHADALEPKLSRLTIKVADSANAPGLVVKRDDKAIGEAELNVPIPVDPGTHVISAIAPKKRAWSRSIKISDIPNTTELVVVPQLQDVPDAPEPKHKEFVVVDEPTKGNTQRVVGLVAGGIGIAGIATGAILGIAAKNKYDQSDAHCSGNYCDQTGSQERHDAFSSAGIATGFWVGGAVFLAGGAVLYFSAPRAKLVNVGIAPTPGGAQGSFRVEF